MCLKLTPWVAIGSVPVWLAVVLVLVVVEAVAADVQPQIAGESEQAPHGLAVESSSAACPVTCDAMKQNQLAW